MDKSKNLPNPNLQVEKISVGVERDFSSATTLNDLLNSGAVLTPDAIALVYDGLEMSFSELDKKTNQIAQFLNSLGAKEENVIGICLDRGINMVLGILGILKSGAAYVPIDPTNPAERINYIINDTKMVALFTDRDWELNSNLPIVNLTDGNTFDHFPTSTVKTNLRPLNLAYIIYTSGSTGMPKGVMIEHRNIVNYLRYSTEIYINNDITASGSYFYMAYTFDAAITSLFLPLIIGKKIVISSKNSFDVFEDPALIENAPYDFIKITPAHLSFFNLKIDTDKFLTNTLIVGGEELKPESVVDFTENKNLNIYNEYGPTECTIGCTFFRFNPSNGIKGKIPIGKPFANCKSFVLDESQNLLPIGEIGELYLGGNQVARGYVNRIDLTELKFIESPFNPQEKLYRTGDICKWLPDGDLEYLGRTDDQVKINGYRIELGEIENTLERSAFIKEAVVLAVDGEESSKKLVAYFVAKTSVFKLANVQKYLAEVLPEYLIPHLFVQLQQLPLTGNGKYDKKALLALKIERPDLNTIYKKPSNKLEENISKVWIKFLGIEKIGIDDNFFELGGNSLLAQKTVTELKLYYGYKIAITKLYQQPTIAGLAKIIDKAALSTRSKTKRSNELSATDIAVIGMSGRFPGADTIQEFWDLLTKNKETTSFFTASELDKNIPPHIANDPSYVKARGILKDATLFDPTFFGITPRLAELMDPQQRVFLEIAWETLEKTGHLPSKYEQKIGVFAGLGTNTYYENNVLSHLDKVENQGKMQVLSVNEKDYAASRTAYHLNLKGPAVSVNSACSTSLLAISQAVTSLRAGQCDAALAGGASITSPIKSGHIYQEGSMLSEDGHCKPFDDNATGTVFSDGAGVVLLKRLEDAQQDGDTIFAVIKGVGINNDGYGKGSFTAPSSEGQADAILSAIEDAGVNASEISYIEAHGTGTPIGDPIEFEGLLDAFGDQPENQFCAIGSVKSNFGHLTQAAGVAGFIKTCLALYHKKIPASLGYSVPNKNIDFVNSPFFVNNTLRNWETTNKRIAGVSSFGVGGTNVHVVLAEYENKISESDSSNKPVLITWSANSENSRTKYSEALKKYVETNSNTKLADIAYSLNKSRVDFRYRRFAVAASNEELVEILEKSPAANSNFLSEAVGEIVFTFPGQGAQYLNMGLQLYDSEPVYKNAIDECAALLHAFINEDIRKIIFPIEITDEASAKLKDTRWTQPALFVTEYAMAKLWMSAGIKPSLLCGHSIGEYVSAHLSGVFSLADGLKLIATRGALISDLPSGDMLSIRENVDIITPYLKGDLSIAAINSAKLVVVAGPKDQIAALSNSLNEREIANKLLFTSHAFHSSMMDPILDKFNETVLTVKLSPPKIPIISTVTGKLLSNEEALNPTYWTTHLRKPVLFSKAVESILERDSPVFLEVGPGTVTTTLTKQIALGLSKNSKGVSTINSSQNEHVSFLKALGQLWLYGVSLALFKPFEGKNRRFLDLPTYQFDRKNYWVEILDREPQITNESINHTNLPSQETKLSTQIMRKNNLTTKVKQLLEDASGIEMDGIDLDENFLEIGLDSLLLTQVAISLKRAFNLPITFRKLNEEYPTIGSLVNYLDQNTPADPAVAEPQNHVPQLNPTLVQIQYATPQNIGLTAVPTSDSALGLIAQQLEILSKQVMLMQGQAPASTPKQPTNTASAVPKFVQEPKLIDSDLSPEEKAEIAKPFGATPKIERQSTTLNAKQQKFLADLTLSYNNKTAKSKQYTSESRAYMADPRVVTGFRPATKELVYPVVINKSKGSRLWDLDGNEYIDALNGFGSNMLGYQPEVIKSAMHDQIEKGYEVGPQHELAAEVSKLICEFTSFDRAALCSTGSEAVLGCIRIARTVTGKSLIIAFSGSYHGIVDEVLVRGTKKLKSFPAAAGIMPESVQNILVLDYGTDEALAIIKERADEIAAVVVEPIQSRRPEFVPIDFLKEVREITTNSGAVLIFDEVITGFRMHPGGAQAIFGIKADLASYGKVIGAGTPIGVIAGKSYLMDALDGGTWNYGDTSYPEVGVTYFAGTFVRHPLALASAKASLTYMKQRGPALQRELNEKGAYISEILNREFEQRQLPIFIANYGSLWKIKFHEEIAYSELLFVLLREKGIHILEGFPCFITEATSYQDIEKIIEAFRKSLNEMTEAEFFPALATESEPKQHRSKIVTDAKNPPVEGAKLGKDKFGNPGWFIKDPNNEGKYLQVGIN